MLQVNFILIHIIHKISVLLKITRFLNALVDFIFYKKRNNYFFTTYNNENFKFKEDKNIEDNIINDIINLFRLKFRLKKEINNNTIKDIRNLFRLEKENKAIKDRIIRDIRNLVEHDEEENYYKPVRVGNFWSNNYIEYKSKGDRKRYQLKNIIPILDHT